MARTTAVTAVLTWLNAHQTLTGRGKPLDHGAFRTRPRSPSRGAYALLTRIDSADALIAEEAVDQARIAAVIYAATDEAAETAATAYANELAALSGTPTPMGDVTCLVVDDITGPLFVDDRAGDGEQFAYAVDADFFLINGGS